MPNPDDTQHSALRLVGTYQAPPGKYNICCLSGALSLEIRMRPMCVARDGRDDAGLPQGREPQALHHYAAAAAEPHAAACRREAGWVKR